MAEEAQSEGGLEFHPLDQFIVKPLFPSYETAESFDLATGIATLPGGHEVAMTTAQIEEAASGTLHINLFEAGLQQIAWYTPTNVTLWMAVAVLCIYLLLVVGSSSRSIVPTRLQSLGEMIYSFIYKMVEDVCGHDGIKYFPYIMTLFMFILIANFLGLLPMAFTTTSHIAVTAVLGFGVFICVTLLGFVLNGASFLGMFWMKDAPLILRPVIAIIEIISYFVRPVSHSIRLAGNIMAGHAVIKVFAGFAAIAVISPLSIAAITAIYGLEVLVAGIQAYVFTILTCVYLKDALHPHH